LQYYIIKCEILNTPNVLHKQNSERHFVQT